MSDGQQKTRFGGFFVVLEKTEIPCGSDLAREGAGTSDISAGRNIAFASKLAPTGSSAPTEVKRYPARIL